MIETGRIDQNLQVLNGVERAWSLPSLPDPVKLDLASQNGIDGQGIDTFLNGLHSDLQEIAAPKPTPLTIAAPATADPFGLALPAPSVIEELRSSWHDWANLPPLQTSADTAVQRLKAKAIERGLLAEETPIDGSWTPELNGVKRELALSELSDRYSGQRDGALSMQNISKFIGDWLTPTGLVDAAIQMDFLPDVNQIGKETKSWGDKWRGFFEKPSPMKLVDAVTGPIDDIVVPLINIGLLATGVSEVMIFGRGATYGIQGAEVVRGMYGGSRLGKILTSVDPLIDAGRTGLARPSFAAEMLSRTNKATKVGHSMEQWRDLKAVLGAKKVTQQAMRLGFAGRLEQSLLPSQEGIGLGDIAPQSLEAYKKYVVQNPLVSTAVDTLFTPAYIFEPGSIGVAARGAQSAAAKAPVVGHFFTPVAEDVKVGVEFHKGVHRWLSAKVGTEEGAAALKTYEDTVKTEGVTAALAKTLAPGDPDATESLGKLMTYVMTSAAIDHDARATSMALNLRGDKFDGLYHKIRNKHLAQLRYVDPENVDELLYLKATLEGTGTSKPTHAIFNDLQARVADETERLGSSPILDDMRTLAVDQNEKRQAIWKELLDKNIVEGLMEEYVPQVADTFGNWQKFVAGQDIVREAHTAGLLDGALIMPAKSEANRRLGLALTDTADAMGPQMRMFGATDYAEFIPAAMLNPLAKPLDPGIGKFTVAKLDTVTKQEMLEFGARVRRRQTLIKNLRQIERDANQTAAFDLLGEHAAAAGLDSITKIPNPVVSEMVDAMEFHNVDVTRRIKRVVRYMREAGVDTLADTRSTVLAELDQLNESPVWRDRFGIHNVELDRAGKVQRLSLDDKVKEAQRRAKFTAAQVENIPEGLDTHLQSLGYKLVHGVDYLMPADLLDVSEFATIGKAELQRVTLGNLTERQDSKMLGAIVRRRQHEEIAKRLTALEAKGVDIGGVDADIAMQSVHNILTSTGLQFQQRLDEADYGGFFTKIFERARSGTAPRGVSDLGSVWHYKRVIHGLEKVGYDRAVAEEIWKGIKQGTLELGFKRRGLLAIQDHLEANPILKDGLMLYGKSAANEKWNGMKGVRTAVKAGTVAGGAFAGDQWAQEHGMDGTTGAIAGAALGFLGPKAALKAMPKVLERYPDWQRYAYLPDYLARYRDFLRFNLSPIFDAQRYTEGLHLAQMEELPQGVRIKLNQSPRSFKRQYGEAEFLQARGEWRHAVRGVFGSDEWDTLEDTSRWFTSVGITGYNPENWMASTFGHLRKAGLSPEESVNAVKRIYAYGEKGRSAAELSVNFVFFPFSFQKKVAMGMAKHLSKDLSRAVFLHDAMKTYDVLDEHFDIGKELKEHIPVARFVSRFNPLAYGLSPGRIGGINRELIEIFGTTAIRVGRGENAVTPEQLKEIGLNMLPGFNDAGTMMQEVGEQGHVIMAGSHVTTREEANRGWEASSELRKGFVELLNEKGLSYRQVMRASDTENPQLLPFKQLYLGAQAGIGEQFPAYRDSLVSAGQRRVDLDEEMRHRESRFYAGTGTKSDAALVEFDQIDKYVNSVLQAQGISMSSDASAIPPEVFDMVRKAAVTLSDRTPEFKRLYKRFFENKYGPITTEVI